MACVRVSRGRFAPERFAAVERMLRESEARLAGPLRGLPGLLSYRTGADPQTNTMIAVSIWESAEQAAALGSLAAMQAERVHFQAAGIAFDPIATYPILWEV